MMLDFLTALADGGIKKLQSTDPKDREHLISMMVTALDLGTELMRESPEFRRAFARVHEEFLHYPESRGSLEEGLRAYERFGPKSDLH
jgi:hypothetical protein